MKKSEEKRRKKLIIFGVIVFVLYIVSVSFVNAPKHNLPDSEVYWYTQQYEKIEKQRKECERSEKEEEEELAKLKIEAEKEDTTGMGSWEYFNSAHGKLSQAVSYGGGQTKMCKFTLSGYIDSYNYHTESLREYREVSFEGLPFPDIIEEVPMSELAK